MSVKAPASLPHVGLLLEAAEGSGTLVATLGALTASGAGAVVVGGITVKTLASISLASGGTVVFSQGSIDAPVPLPHLSLVLYHIAGVAGFLNKTLENATLVSEVDAPGNEIWAYEDEDKPARAPIYWPHARDVSWFQTDTVLRADSGGVFGVVGSNLQPLSRTITGAVLVSGTLAKTLDDLTVDEITGAVEVSCTLAKTLDAMTCVSTATTVGDIVGTTFATFGALTASGTIGAEVSGTVSKTLANLSRIVRATVDVGGTVNKTLQDINANIDGSVLSGFVCVTIQTLAPMTCVARGNNGAVRKDEAGAPAKKGKSKKKPIVIKIDDEVFVVETIEEAQELYDNALQIAAVQAKQQADAHLKSKSAQKRFTERIKLDIPKVATQEEAAQEFVTKLREGLTSIYEKAEIDAEVALNVEKQRQLDEEDALVLLLLN